MSESELPESSEQQAEPRDENASDVSLIDPNLPAAQSSKQDDVIAALREVYDPEIPVNIYDLGLIYHIDISDTGMVAIQMTLTTPGCPVAHTFPVMIENAVREVAWVESCAVMIVWDPPWTQDRMSQAAKLQLGLL